jgi:intraflagellar transport protein 122
MQTDWVEVKLSRRRNEGGHERSQGVCVLCRDFVKKVAVYKDRVAIQLPNRVVLYRLEEGAGDLDMQYHNAAKINKKLECNLLVVTSQHIVLCQVRG